MSHTSRIVVQGLFAGPRGIICMRGAGRTCLRTKPRGLKNAFHRVPARRMPALGTTLRAVCTGSIRISRFVNHSGTPNKRARQCRALSAAFAHRIYKGVPRTPRSVCVGNKKRTSLTRPAAPTILPLFCTKIKMQTCDFHMIGDDIMSVRLRTHQRHRG